MSLILYFFIIKKILSRRRFWKSLLSKHWTKKWSFPLRIYSVNVAKSAGSCWFGHIYWINLYWKPSFLCSERSCKVLQNIKGNQTKIKSAKSKWSNDGYLNPFLANVPVLYPLKTTANLLFSGVFRRYKIRPLARNGLIQMINLICIPVLNTAQKMKFPLRIFSVNVNKSAVSCSLLIFAEIILNGKLHFLCSGMSLNTTFTCLKSINNRNTG